jgi:hypothetical protein
MAMHSANAHENVEIFVKIYVWLYAVETNLLKKMH